MWSFNSFTPWSSGSDSPSTAETRSRPAPGPLARAANERHRQLVRFNESPCADPDAATLADCIEVQAACTPERPAVREGGTVYSYGAVLGQAREIARGLRFRGVTRGDRVGLLLDRPVDRAVAMLGVWIAGGVCVPLTGGPALEGVIERGGLSQILTDDGSGEAVPSPVHVPVRSMRQLGDPLDGADGLGEAGGLGPDDPAVIGYGGWGAAAQRDVLTHRALINRICWHREQSAVDGSGGTVQGAAPSSLLFVHEVGAAWGTGGCLVIPPPDVRGSLSRLVHFMFAESVHRVVLPASLLSHFAEVALNEGVPLKHLRELTAVGAPVRFTRPVDALFSSLPDCALETLYGPRPDLVCMGYRRAGDVAAWDRRPLLGRPLPDARVYVLGDQRQLVPMGAASELYVGGPLVSQRARLDQDHPEPDRWVADPYGEEPGGVLYRTGDRARFLDDGTVEVLAASPAMGEGPADRHDVRVPAGRVS